MYDIFLNWFTLPLSTTGSLWSMTVECHVNIYVYIQRVTGVRVQNIDNVLLPRPQFLGHKKVGRKTLRN